MLNFFTTAVRTLLLAALLLFAAQGAEAGTSSGTALTVATTRTGTDVPAVGDDDTLGGVLIIVGIIGGLILLAWIASRIGDNRSDTVG